MTSVSAGSGIVAQDMCKSFDDHLVLDKVSLAVEEGTILAFLGPNGAGKTTLVRILSTLIPADSGSMRIAGHYVVTDPDGVRAVIGRGESAADEDLAVGQRTCSDGRLATRPRGWAAAVASCWSSSTSPTPLTSCFRPLRRDATTARPGDDPRRQAPGDFPRRAHHRPGPAQPSHHVADHS